MVYDFVQFFEAVAKRLNLNFEKIKIRRDEFYRIYDINKRYNFLFSIIIKKDGKIIIIESPYSSESISLGPYSKEELKDKAKFELIIKIRDYVKIIDIKNYEIRLKDLNNKKLKIVK